MSRTSSRARVTDSNEKIGSYDKLLRKPLWTPDRRVVRPQSHVMRASSHVGTPVFDPEVHGNIDDDEGWGSAGDEFLNSITFSAARPRAEHQAYDVIVDYASDDDVEAFTFSPVKLAPQYAYASSVPKHVQTPKKSSSLQRMVWNSAKRCVEGTEFDEELSNRPTKVHRIATPIRKQNRRGNRSMDDVENDAGERQDREREREAPDSKLHATMSHDVTVTHDRHYSESADQTSDHSSLTSEAHPKRTASGVARRLDLYHCPSPLAVHPALSNPSSASSVGRACKSPRVRLVRSVHNHGPLQQLETLPLPSNIVSTDTARRTQCFDPYSRPKSLTGRRARETDDRSRAGAGVVPRAAYWPERPGVRSLPTTRPVPFTFLTEQRAERPSLVPTPTPTVALVPGQTKRLMTEALGIERKKRMSQRSGWRECGVETVAAWAIGQQRAQVERDGGPSGAA